MIIGYIDTNIKNILPEEQKDILTRYAVDHKCNIDIFLEYAQISSLLTNIQSPNCTLLLANAVCLGNSLQNVRDNLHLLIHKVAKLVCITEGIELFPDFETELLIKGIGLSVQIRNSLASVITKKALAAKKADIDRTERKTRNKKRILDNKIDEIILRKSQGQTNAQIADAFNVHEVTFYTFMRQHPEIKRKLAEINNA